MLSLEIQEPENEIKLKNGFSNLKLNMISNYLGDLTQYEYYLYVKFNEDQDLIDIL